MKKHLKYIILTFFILFNLNLTNVLAEKIYDSNINSLYCYYNGNSGYELLCKVESSGTVGCQLTNEGSLLNSMGLGEVKVKYDDFKKNDNYVCPVIYAEEITTSVTTDPGTVTAYNHMINLSTSEFEKQKNVYSMTFSYFEFKHDENKSYVAGNGQSSNGNLNYIDECSDAPETIKLIKQIYNVLRFLIPIIVIGLSIVDFLKVLLSGEEKVYKQAWSKFVKRIIIGIIILILPVILSFIIKLSGVLGNYNIDQNNIFCIFY